MRAPSPFSPNNCLSSSVTTHGCVPGRGTGGVAVATSLVPINAASRFDAAADADKERAKPATRPNVASETCLIMETPGARIDNVVVRCIGVARVCQMVLVRPGRDGPYSAMCGVFCCVVSVGYLP